MRTTYLCGRAIHLYLYLLLLTFYYVHAGAMILAQTIPPGYTPRSKHYAIKTNWFREHIVKGGIELLKGSHHAHA